MVMKRPSTDSIALLLHLNQTLTLSAVPEPGTTGLLVVALGVGAVLFKSNRRAQLRKP